MTRVALRNQRRSKSVIISTVLESARIRPTRYSQV